MDHFLHHVADTAQSHGWNLYGYSMIDCDGHSTTIHPVRTSACCNCYSIAKIFTVTALGLLHDRGLLHWDERIIELFPNEFPHSYDSHWDSVTIDHVIRHRWGIDAGFLDIDTEDITAYPSSDFLQIVLSRHLPFTPGSHRQYSDAAYYLLSRVVTKKTGERLDRFLMHHLFQPLQFQEAAWSTCPNGYSIGATGLYIRTEDMVKLGFLYENHGSWKGRQLLSSEFVSHAVQSHYEWMPLSNTDIYGKRGMNGQMLLFSPQHHKAIAWHAFDVTGFSRDLFDLTLEYLCSC